MSSKCHTPVPSCRLSLLHRLRFGAVIISAARPEAYQQWPSISFLYTLYRTVRWNKGITCPPWTGWEKEGMVFRITAAVLRYMLTSRWRRKEWDLSITCLLVSGNLCICGAKRTEQQWWNHNAFFCDSVWVWIPCQFLMSTFRPFLSFKRAPQPHPQPAGYLVMKVRAKILFHLFVSFNGACVAMTSRGVKLPGL